MPVHKYARRARYRDAPYFSIGPTFRTGIFIFYRSDMLNEISFYRHYSHLTKLSIQTHKLIY